VPLYALVEYTKNIQMTLYDRHFALEPKLLDSPVAATSEIYSGRKVAAQGSEPFYASRPRFFLAKHKLILGAQYKVLLSDPHKPRELSRIC